MSDVKRYSLDLEGGKPSIEEDERGGYVLYDDYDAAQQRADRAEAHIKVLEDEQVNTCSLAEQSNAALEGRIAAAKWKLLEALYGRRNDMSWARPLMLTMAERQDLYEQVLLELDTPKSSHLLALTQIAKRLPNWKHVEWKVERTDSGGWTVKGSNGYYFAKFYVKEDATIMRDLLQWRREW